MLCLCRHEPLQNLINNDIVLKAVVDSIANVPCAAAGNVRSAGVRSHVV